MLTIILAVLGAFAFGLVVMYETIAWTLRGMFRF